MKQTGLTRMALSALAMTCTASAWACGPDFPMNLLDDRADTLTRLPSHGFAREAMSLLPAPATRFKANERAEWIYTDAVTRDDAERGWLGDGFDKAARARAQTDPQVAYDVANGLPEEARRYLAAAVAYEQGLTDEALDRFASVLELPAEQRRHYGPWALYMQGRMQADEAPMRAVEAFAGVRAAVAAGADDPLGLALDSYGEQARLLLVIREDAAAARLYAEQAAQGSQFGRASLLRVARDLVADDARLDAAARDPLLRQLVVAYLITRDGPDDYGDDPAPPDGAAERFADALARQDIGAVEGVGRLAAFAYRNGRHELASKLVAQGNDGLTAWVRAKLALRAGDVDAATVAYAQAAKAFPLDEPDPNADHDAARRPGADYCRVRGESGTLALARGEYVVAMDHFFHADDWIDAAFVAERVLTLDELADWIAKNAAQPGRAAGADGTVDPVTPLRALFARRLLREQRWDEAIAFFDEAELRAKAQAYADARRAATRGGRIEQAQAWYRAATLARRDGMELIGYELGPDMTVWGGSYAAAYSFGYETAEGQSTASLPFATAPTDGERTRVAATRAQPDERFHYRYLAAEFAARAADLVPNRSQAYAALLCAATGYVIDDDATLGRTYWQRYVARGPFVPWAANFGRNCQVPDFDGAARRLHAERIAHAKRLARQALPPVLIVGALAVVAFVLYRRRRTRDAGK